MNGELKISHKFIRRNYPPFIIAEMFGNHNLLLESDLEIVKAAAKTSAHALKTDTMLFSMEPSEITQLVVETEQSWQGLG